MRAQKERYRTASEPLVVLALFIGILLLTSFGVIDPIVIGIVGTVTVFLLFIEPYLYRMGLIKGAEQKFLYSLLVVCIGLLLYGGITKGIIPVVSFTGSLVLDTIFSISLYTILLIIILALIIGYLFRDELKKYF